MKRFSPVALLAVLVAAGAISACSDGTAPTATPRSSARADAPVNLSRDPLEAGSYAIIDMPGATTTVAFGINNDGVIVGRYLMAGRTHGFVRSADGEFTTIDFPGAGFTVAGNLNNRGDILGWYTLPAAPAVRHGFLLRQGEFTSFDPPGSVFTNPLGINDRGDIVGRYCTNGLCREPGNGDFHGFLLRDGVFTNIDVPGSNETNAFNINDRDEILGGAGTADGKGELFLLRNGQLTTWALPDGKTLAQDHGGLNARGDIAGKYCDKSPCLIGPTGHGFVLIDGRFTTVDVPGSLGGGTFGINNRREVVGGYYDGSGVLHGFVIRLDRDATASTRWNGRTASLLVSRPPGNAQAATSRILTYLSIAQYRAVLAADGAKAGSLHPSIRAAVNGASVAVLSEFFPLDVAKIEGWLNEDRAADTWQGEKNDEVGAGEAIGRAIAATVIAQSKTDNYLVASPGLPPVGPGYWLNAPGMSPVRSLYGVRPFFLTSSDQLRPAPPPAFGSTEFLQALHEIREISDTRTAEQIATAQFYAWATAPFTAGNLNLMADQLIVEKHSTEREAARILAYANAAAFDAQIACFDAKYHYWYIRPSQADSANLVTGNRGITLTLALPNHPSYPSGHSCITSAIANVLIDAFPSERERLESLITTIGLSRMYAGLHYRFDVEAGQAIGREAAALARAGSLE
jgi:membrane-associated phospholipid phosphatase/uncharacterized membrane protein